MGDFETKLRESALLRSPRSESPARAPIRPLVAQIHPIGNQSARRFAESCPAHLPSPSSCPFGGICHSCPAPVQAKLVIGPPDDEYEKEADRIADEVMRRPDPQVQRACPTCDEDEERVQAKPLADRITPLVQRQADPEDEEEEILQPKLADAVQRQAEIPEEEEEEAIQMKRGGTATAVASPETAASIASLRGGGRSLTASERAFFEPRFGLGFSDVRIHDTPRASQTASAISARAFTRGTDIVLGAGHSATATRAGRQLLAHELTHVVQQGSLAEAAGEDRIRRQAASTLQQEEDDPAGPGTGPWTVGATTPDGADLGPTSTTDTFCKRGTFLGRYGSSQNNATHAQANAVISFRGTARGRRGGSACSNSCALYRQFVKHYWRTGSPTAPKRHDISSCGNTLAASETSWTEEYTSCIGDDDPTPSRFLYSDFPGFHGLSDGLYADAWWKFKFQIWDACRNRPVSTATNTLRIRGSAAPRTITWAYQ